jgi:signal peptidase I
MREVLETLRIVVGLLLIFALVGAFWLIKPSKMEKADQSMQPTLMADTRVYFWRNVQTIDDLKPGQIILYSSLDPETQQRKSNISRVIAMPGQRVKVGSGKLEIDGKPPAGSLDQPGRIPVDIPEIAVPRQHVFVMYDKRDMDDRRLYERLVHVSRVEGTQLKRK